MRWLVVPLFPLLMLELAGCRDAEQTSTTSTTGAEITDPKATHQANTSEDLDLVASIRRRLVADTGLSMRAKNAVIVVQDGVVTLRGDVADKVEHDLVVAKVASVPGVVRVDDRLAFKE